MPPQRGLSEPPPDIVGSRLADLATPSFCAQDIAKLQEEEGRGVKLIGWTPQPQCRLAVTFGDKPFEDDAGINDIRRHPM